MAIGNSIFYCLVVLFQNRSSILAEESLRCGDEIGQLEGSIYLL